MEANQVGTKRDARTAMWIAASMMVAFLAVGCGRGNKQQAAATTGDRPIPASENVTTAAIVQASAVTPEVATTQETQETVSQIDMLPPDVAPSVTDSLAIPGEVIEITAMASSDASSLVLTDALGKKYPFSYDPTSNEWRVSYRVPIKIHADRLGLSVTATNAGHRFKRVWVFLPVQGQ